MPKQKNEAIRYKAGIAKLKPVNKKANTKSSLVNKCAIAVWALLGIKSADVLS